MKSKISVKLWRSFLVMALMADLIPQIGITSVEISSWYNAHRDKSFHRAMAWIRENSGEKDIILTTWQLGAQIPAFTGRRVIASSKVYPSEARKVARRYSDIKNFFNVTGNESEALEIAEKYNAEFIFFQSGWRVKKNTILEKMNKKRPLRFFTPVYDSGKYMIYRVERDKNEYAEDLIATLDQLSDITSETDTVFVPYPASKGITLNFKGKTVSPGAGISNSDAITFLFSMSEEQASRIAKEHGIDLIAVSRSHLPLIEGNEDKILAYLSPVSKKLNLKGRATVLGRMLNNRKMNHFKPVLSTNKYLVYRRVDPDVYFHFTRDFGLEKELIGLFNKKYMPLDRLPRVYGCIVPHLIPSPEFRQLSALLFRELSRNQEIDTMIILAPDHFKSGKDDISISLRDWVTPFGILKTDRKKSEYLIEKGLATVDEEAHETEHSIIAILPLIKYKFPETRIVPILLKRNTSPEDAEQLGLAISGLLDERTLVVVSCDLSHFHSPEEAYLRDKKSIETIRDLKREDLYGLEIDCPSGIYALLTAMEHAGSEKTKILGRMDSGPISGQKGVVGYCVMIFSKD